MKHLRPLLFAWLCAVTVFITGLGSASADSSHIVVSGESLTSIAYQYGITASELAAANGLAWNAWVYVGQTLTIPDGRTAAPSPAPATPAGGATTVYYVQAGDTLFSVGLRFGTTVDALMVANGLSTSTIYAGQKLYVPSSAGLTTPSPVVTGGASVPAPGAGERWIDVNLSTQTITAYEGNVAVNTSLASTGLPRTPTVVGSYRIYVKYVATDMEGGSYAYGDYYYLPDVPYTMYFYKGYGIHGTYWHNNFGNPMSHGCVNLPTPVAEWFFNWASVGTRVETHY